MLFLKSVHYLLTYEALAREAPKDGAALLSKLALSVGSTAERRDAVECGLADGGGAMRTTTCSGCKPIVVHESINKWRSNFIKTDTET